MKPIATVPAALRSVDLLTGEPDEAHVERSDTCAVPAAAVVGEAAVAWILADAFLERFGRDSMRCIEAAWADEQARVASRLTPSGPA